MQRKRVFDKVSVKEGRIGYCEFACDGRGSGKGGSEKTPLFWDLRVGKRPRGGLYKWRRLGRLKKSIGRGWVGRRGVGLRGKGGGETLRIVEVHRCRTPVPWRPVEQQEERKRSG